MAPCEMPSVPQTKEKAAMQQFTSPPLINRSNQPFGLEEQDAADGKSFSVAELELTPGWVLPHACDLVSINSPTSVMLLVKL